MTQSTDLFTLIKALSQTEKAWFKRYSGLHVRGSLNNYVLLFDAIEAQEQYDEKKIIEKFKGSRFVKQFSVAKNYLYGQILNAMHYYHHSAHSEVKKLIHQAEFLIEKGLFRQAEKIIAKGKELAEKNELHWALIELNHHWEYRMAITHYDWAKIRSLFAEEVKMKGLFENLLTYRQMYIMVGSHYSARGYSRDPVRNRLIMLDNNKAYQSAKYARTFRGKVLFYQARFINAYYSGRLAEASTYLFRKIELYDSTPGKIEIEPYYYGNSIHNAITLTFNLREFEKIPGMLAKMERAIVLCTNKAQRKNLSYLFSHQQLSFCLRTCDFDKALSLASSIISDFDKESIPVKSIETVLLLQNAAVACFIKGDLRGCIRILGQIHNEFSFSVHAEDESFFRIFRLIAHFEAGNQDVLPYYIHSTYRFLTRKKQVREFEKIIIDFLRRTLSRNADRNIIKDLVLVKDEIERHVKKEFDQDISLKFDIVSWLESKIENKPFAEILKMKFSRREDISH